MVSQSLKKKYRRENGNHKSNEINEHERPDTTNIKTVIENQ